MGDLGTRIRELLGKKGMTQKDLADRVECTDAAISHYIKGDRIPRSGMLTKIAIALDTTSEYLLEGTPAGVAEEVVYATRLIARNASHMSKADKRRIIEILMGGDDE